MNMFEAFLLENQRELIITPEMVRQARGNMFQFIIEIDPHDFLSVTANASEARAIIQGTSAKSGPTLEDYNRFAREGNSIIPPFITVSMKDEKVIGHEGRHRAGALIRAGGRIMHLFVGLKHHPNLHNIHLTYEHMPDVVIGQFRTGSIVKDRDYTLVSMTRDYR